jgi:uncharacterized protein (DUF58 family)
MLPTSRLLLLLLPVGLLLAGVAYLPVLRWLGVLYLLAVAVVFAVDVYLTPRPQQLEAERINDARLSLGADNRVTLLLANRSPRSVRFTLRDEYPYRFISDAVFVEGTVEPFGLYEGGYHLRPLQRGDYRFGKLNIRYASQLGLFRRQWRYNLEADVKVYPNVLEARKYDLMARKGLLSEIGLRASRTRGGGTEFERLREYTTDDEFRRINWKATARRGKAIAAEFETERSQYVVSVIDTGRLMRPPVGELAKLDYAINTALLLSYVAMLKGDHIGLLTFADDVGTYIAPRRGRGQFYRMLESLYNVQLGPVESDHGRALAYLGLKHKRRSLVVVFTDLATPDAAGPLIAYMARLARRHLPLCVVISDPNVSGLANLPAQASSDIYRRAVAEMLLDERRVVLDTLNRSGVLTIDVPADKLTVSVINTYLELKSRGRL